MAEKKEMINNPLHYGGADDPYEHIKVCENRGWNYHIGNTTKYIWRLGKKDDSIQDAKKAAWYLNRYIQLLEQRAAEEKQKKSVKAK